MFERYLQSTRLSKTENHQRNERKGVNKKNRSIVNQAFEYVTNRIKKKRKKKKKHEQNNNNNKKEKRKCEKRERGEKRGAKEGEERGGSI